jgi:hypothetical protein
VNLFYDVGHRHKGVSVKVALHRSLVELKQALPILPALLLGNPLVVDRRQAPLDRLLGRYKAEPGSRKSLYKSRAQEAKFNPFHWHPKYRTFFLRTLDVTYQKEDANAVYRFAVVVGWVACQA